MARAITVPPLAARARRRHRRNVRRSSRGSVVAASVTAARSRPAPRRSIGGAGDDGEPETLGHVPGSGAYPGGELGLEALEREPEGGPAHADGAHDPPRVVSDRRRQSADAGLELLVLYGPLSLGNPRELLGQPSGIGEGPPRNAVRHLALPHLLALLGGSERDLRFPERGGVRGEAPTEMRDHP